MDGCTHMYTSSLRILHSLFLTLFNQTYPLEDTDTMHAGKNADSRIQPGHLGLLTKIHAFTCTMMNPQVCYQSQQQDALLFLECSYLHLTLPQ